MKKVVYFLFLIPLFINAQAVCHEKNGTGDSASVRDAVNESGANNIQTVAYTSSNNNIKGTPFAFNDWSQGTIKTADNVAIKYDRIQFDLERNQVLVYSNGSQYPSTIPTNNIQSFSTKDKKENRRFTMIAGTEFENAHTNKLYETFSSTNNYLIKEITKIVKTANDDSGKMYYQNKTTYYIKDNSGKYVKTKLSKKQLLKKMNDHEKEIAQYIKKNKLSYNEDDVAKILDYYYSLTLVAKQ